MRPIRSSIHPSSQRATFSANAPLRSIGSFIFSQARPSSHGWISGEGCESLLILHLSSLILHLSSLILHLSSFILFSRPCRQHGGLCKVHLAVNREGAWRRSRTASASSSAQRRASHHERRTSTSGSAGDPRGGLTAAARTWLSGEPPWGTSTTSSSEQLASAPDPIRGRSDLPKDLSARIGSFVFRPASVRRLGC